jgi:hypothetical protein
MSHPFVGVEMKFRRRKFGTVGEWKFDGFSGKFSF